MKGRPVVKYQSNDVMIGINRWNSAAFGYVLGINPSFGAIENFVRNRWKEFDFEKCFKLSPGVFLFIFEGGKIVEQVDEIGKEADSIVDSIIHHEIAAPLLEVVVNNPLALLDEGGETSEKVKIEKKKKLAKHVMVSLGALNSNVKIGSIGKILTRSNKKPVRVKAEFSNISSRVAEKQIELEGLDGKILNGDLSPDILARTTYIEAEYRRLSKAKFQL
ncbi:hypothetical protein LIER_22924 [Lithospermum erythrorhizon]|uniref:Uncharacterized protein n=1 Tax=Lithospermum erythrorhizon TaxID=34254 RepID=A0AAV3QYR8_LITER